VLCNHFEVDENGVLTGGIEKPVIWGTRKADAAQRFCEDNGIDLRLSYFYADGDEDVPLMSVIGHPRPVNPRSGLAAAAAANGWPVLRVAVAGRGG
jgi:phosphoserine phosphatase